MTPTEIRPAIARILMLTAGPIPYENTSTVADALAVFDDEPSITELACTTAVETAAKYRTVPGDTPIFIGDTADLVAFGMLSHALENGRDGLEEHLAQLPATSRGVVAVALLAMWRQACSITAGAALARIEIPETAPTEGPR